MKPLRAVLPVICLLSGASQFLHAAPQAFEVGPDRVHELPRGKEADGIIGDFILRNDLVEAVISGDLPLRRANMSTFYGASGITPGCLYDLTLQGANNDQITIFAPSSQQGEVSWVRVVQDGSAGEAKVESVTSAANNNGLYRRHEYRLRDGWQGVLIVTTLRNESQATKSGTVNDRWTNFSSRGSGRNVSWADAVDPADRAGYAYAWVERDGFEIPPQELKLEPGKEISFARFLAVGRSPAEAAGIIFARAGEVGRVEGTVADENDQPVENVRIEVAGESIDFPAYSDEKGAFAFHLPPGDYELAYADLGRPESSHPLKLAAGQTVPLSVKLERPSLVDFDIRNEQGQSIPCKVQFIGVDGTSSPHLGPANRAHGCRDQYHSETGKFSVQIPPGKYRIVVTRGNEFSHLEKELNVEHGQSLDMSGILKRLVDTRGWVSADFHNHSTPSGDNTCGTDDRVINLAAEHIEFAPTTEHNRLYDWTPHIEKLGLAKEISTVSGMELTGSGAHFNSFPLKPEPFTQDNGAPVWNPDPRITAVTLENHQGLDPDRWIQINHPDMVANFIDRNGDGLADGGFLTLERLIDGLETINGQTAQILSAAPFQITRGRNNRETVSYIREFIWLQLLNRGHKVWCVAVSDAHSVHGNGVGGWRIYVPSSTDDAASIDWREISRHAKAGKIMVTTGPFLEVTAGDGTIAGGSLRATGQVNLRVKVQCTDWIDIDRVQVLVNGRQRKDLNFTRQSHPDMFQDGVVKFDHKLVVPLTEDSHLIVVAHGEDYDLSTGFGSSTQANWRPCAYNNPIFVDVDGRGFTANGDTLGFALPVKGLSVEEAKTMLQQRGL